MHGPIENGDFTVSIAGYQPRLLGTSVNEAAWRLMHRVHEGILNARSTTIPIMQALYADDAEAVTKHQMRAAAVDAVEFSANLLDGPAVKQPDPAGQSGRLDPRARGQDPHDAMDGLAELAGDHPGGD